MHSRFIIALAALAHPWIAGAAFASPQAAPARPAASRPASSRPASSQPATTQAAAPAKLLTIGDPAPALDADTWIQGETDPKFEPGKVYVVEFWNTQCEYCLNGIRLAHNLTGTYREQGFTWLAITEEPAETVRKFIDSDNEGQPWHDLIDFPVASDPDYSVHKAYMEASGQAKIPIAFIVGKGGRLEWIGNPDKIGAPLAAIMKDKWDRAAFKSEYEHTVAPPDAQGMADAKELRDAAAAGDWDRVLAIIERGLQRNPSAIGLKYRKFQVLLGEKNQPDEAYAYLKSIDAECMENMTAASLIAGAIVNDPKVQRRDLDAAMRLATRADQLAGGRSPIILRTIARTHFLKGDYAKAVEWQQKAVDKAVRPEDAEKFAAELEEYQNTAAAADNKGN